MNQEQKVLHNLLRELDEVCRKNDIRYILSPRLAYNAVNGLGMPVNLMYGLILVPESEMERLRLVLENGNFPDRAVESMVNSERFPGFYLRYVDRSTLCYRLSYGRNFRYPCLGINIYPLCGRRGFMPTRIRDRILERGWLTMGDTYQAVYSWKDRVAGAMTRLLSIRGRGRLGKRIYYRLLENRRELPGSMLTCEAFEKGQLISHEMVSARAEAELEGAFFFIPRDFSAYMKAIYDDREGRKEKVQPPSWSVITSAFVRGEDFLRQISDPASIVRRRRRVYLREEKIRRDREYLDECWEWMRFLEKGQNVLYRTSLQKRKIKNLWHDGDYRRLEQVYREYHELVKESLPRGVLLKPDPELYDIYIDLLRHTGSFGWLKKILAFTPDQAAGG